MKDRTPEYYNVVIDHGPHTYRVAFHRGGRAMICCRKTSRGETALNLDGPTAKIIIERAKKVAR